MAPSPTVLDIPMRPTFVIIDGNYQTYRFHFGMANISGPDGRPTGATRCFADLFHDLRQHSRISHWALVLDHRDPSFRHLLYPAYKGQRPPMPDEIRSQLADIERLAEACDVPVVKVPGYEADDVLVTLARQADAAGYDAWIMTKDKDIDQCLNAAISTWDPYSGRLRGPADLFRERGIHPHQVIDYLTLVGDASDNIPGVHGVGPKRAIQLLERFGTATEAVRRAAEVQGKLGENLAAFTEQEPLTRELVTIVDVPDLPPIEQFRQSPHPPDTARSLFAELGFHATRFFPAADRPRDALAGCWTGVIKADDLPILTRSLAEESDQPHSLRFACLGDNPHHALIMGLAIAPAPAALRPDGVEAARSACYLPVLGPERNRLLDWDDITTALTASWAQGGWIVPDRQQTQVLMHRQQQRLGAGGGDIHLAAWLLGAPDHLSDLVSRHLGETGLSNDGPTPTMPIDDAARLLGGQASCQWRLHQALLEKLADTDMAGAYTDHHLPLADQLAAMEVRGLPLHGDTLGRHRDDLIAYRQQLRDDLRELVTRKFDPDDGRHLRYLLSRQLEVLPAQATLPVTVDDWAALADRHEITELLYQYRQCGALLDEVCDRLHEAIHPVTGRIHSRLRQTSTTSGRLVGTCPDLGSMPGRRDLGREIRAAFQARPGRRLVGAEIGQLPLRVLAHLARCDDLTNALDDDVHRRLAAVLFACEPDLIGGRQRRQAKDFHYGWLAGRTTFGLAQTLDGQRDLVDKSIDAYRRTYKRAAQFVEELPDRVRERGYATSLAGRRRTIPELSSPNRNQQLQGIALALACTVQGSAADILTGAVLHCAAHLPADADLLLQVNDEILVECPEERAEVVASTIQDAISAAWPLDVPIAVSTRIGTHWLAATP